jgi:hypothetical protein
MKRDMVTIGNHRRGERAAKKSWANIKEIGKCRKQYVAPPSASQGAGEAKATTK